MPEDYRKQLISWNNKTDARQKLQLVYLLTIVVSFVAAGLCGLISYRLGHNILTITVAAIVIFVVNAVVWALLQSFLLAKLPARTGRAKR